MLGSARTGTPNVKRNLLRSSIVAAATFSLAPTVSHAASFMLLEQSPAHLGHSFAGTASNVRDASTVFYNPAGMSQLNRRELTGGLNLVMPNSKFDDRASNTGSIGGETDETEFIPNLYYSHPFNDQITFGVGISVPFGLTSDWGSDWSGRYLATNSELEMLNLHANIAYQVDERLSLGAGISYQDLDVTLDSQVDSTLGQNPSPETDSSASVTGDDTDIVFDLSAFYQLTNRTSLGFIWRQGGTFSLRGDARFSLNPACVNGPTAGQCGELISTLEGPVRADVNLPDTITVSGTHMFNENWTLHADIAWTQWSNIQFVDVVNLENDNLVDSLELEYDDTFRFAVGATWHVEGPFTWRFGLARDHAPQTDPTRVSPRIPDGDRTWLSAGAHYEFSDDISFDIGYAHLFVSSDNIANADAQTGNTVVGSFDSHVNILAAQVNWGF